MKLHHRKSANDSNESDPVRDAASAAAPVHRDANHKPETPNKALWRDRLDRLAIERGEDEGMTVRAG